MLDVRFPAREKIIEANDLMAFVQKAFTKMRAEKARATGDENAHGARPWEKPGAAPENPADVSSSSQIRGYRSAADLRERPKKLST
jgi:hypothetical protein